MLEIINEIIPGYELKYNKFYIGLALNGKTDNFIVFRAKKNFLRIELRMDFSEEAQNIIDDSDLDYLDYDNKDGRFKFTVRDVNFENNKEVLWKLIKMAKNISEEETNLSAIVT